MGGAIANEGGIVQLEQTGIYDSHAPYGGAFNGTGYETFVNVTISGNTATQAGGGLRFWRSPCQYYGKYDHGQPGQYLRWWRH